MDLYFQSIDILITRMVDQENTTLTPGQRIIDQIETDISQLGVSLGATTKCNREIKGNDYCHIPLALFPIPVPYKLYRDALIKEEAMGVLYAMMCAKPDLIYRTLGPCIK